MSHRLYWVTKMKRNVVFLKDYFSLHSLTALLICGAFFLCGSVAGAYASGHITDGSALSGYLAEYLLRLCEGRGNASLLAVLLGSVKYHVLAVLFGFSALGVVTVPCLAGLRGFFLSFSVAAVTRVYGASGIPVALALFGFSALFSLPCFFLLAVQSFRAAARLGEFVLHEHPRPGAQIYGKRFFGTCVVCFVIVLISALVNQAASAFLLRLALSWT